MKAAEIEDLLPDVFQRTIQPDNPLATYLAVMESLQAPSEDVLAGLDRFFDAYRTPDAFLPFLARWVDLDWLMVEEPEDSLPGDFVPLGSGTGRLRELISSAASLSRRRGTAAGLVNFLEIATGVPGFEVAEQRRDDEGKEKPFHLLVRVPPGAQRFAAIVERIVEQQKPAYVTHELVLEP